MPSFSIDYTQDIETVYRFMTDPDAIRKRCEALGETNIRVHVDEAGGTKTLTITRDVERELPSFAKKLFNSTNTVTERLEWRDSGGDKTCKSHVDIAGTPAKIDSNITIASKAEGCTYDIEFEVSVKVPLIRKKLEEFAAKATLESIRDQQEYNRRQLDAVG